MSKFISKKQQLVNNWSDLFIKHESFLVFEFHSLNCDNFSSLRKRLRKFDSKIIVGKNNIINRSLIKTKLIGDANFAGQNAVLFAHDDLAAIQEVGKLCKTFKDVKLKVAYFDKILLKDNDLNEVTSLRSKPDLIATFAQLLQQPIYKLIFILNNLKNE